MSNFAEKLQELFYEKEENVMWLSEKYHIDYSNIYSIVRKVQNYNQR